MQLFKNNAYSSLASTLLIAGTSMTVATGTGDRFPVVAGSDFALVTIQDAANRIEIVKVTARALGSDAMTIVRAQESTTALNWAIGDVVECRITAGSIAPLSVMTSASTPAAVRAAIGSGAIGDAMFLTATAAAARALIGALSASDTIANATASASCSGNASTVTNGIYTTNIGSYAPSLTGGGASGTWGINVTGSAGSAPAAGGTSAACSGNSATATTDSQHFGVGQTWQNVTGSRASSTTYTNSTGKPIMVCVNINSTGSAFGLTFTVNGTALAGSLHAASTAGYAMNETIVVPNGQTYSWSLNGATLTAVWELR